MPEVSKHSMTGKPPVVPQYRYPDDSHSSVLQFGPGDEAAPTELSSRYGYRGGDFILTRDSSWTSRLIRFGQRLRYRGEEAKYAHWNHACVIIDNGGTLVEAVANGVVYSNISRFMPEEYVLVQVPYSVEDRQQVVDFACWAAGSKYGFLTVLSIAWALLTGGKFSFGIAGEHICSGLVARALERGEAIWDRPPSHIMPADLARYFNVG